MPYSPLLVKPFREELTSIGFQELMTAEDVEKWMENKTGTALLVINSVLGCAAGTMRPGVRLALEESTQKPTRLATVFDEQDLEATARARSYFADIPPSHPSIALFKDGELVYFIPKHRIESRDATSMARDLVATFEEHCSK